MIGNPDGRVRRLEQRHRTPDPYARMTDEELAAEFDRLLGLELPEQIARWRRQAEGGDAVAVALLAVVREALG